MKLANIAFIVLMVGVASLLSGAANAGILIYDFAWSGSNGYTMTGTFAFDSAAGGDGRIDETELQSLSIHGFQAGNPVGNWNLGDPYVGAEPFNFNFDPVAQQFFLGGASGGLSGQNWNDDGNSGGGSCGNPGFGFNAGNGGQDICVNGVLVSSADATAPISVTQRVPEPATLALLGIGLAGLGFARRRKQ